MNKNQKIGLRAIMYSVAHLLLIAVLYNIGFYFLAGVMLGIWLIFWIMVFDEWNELNKETKGTKK
jgi:hypothetical protein